jgi:hypothetical protein
MSEMYDMTQLNARIKMEEKQMEREENDVNELPPLENTALVTEQLENRLPTAVLLTVDQCLPSIYADEQQCPLPESRLQIKSNGNYSWVELNSLRQNQNVVLTYITPRFQTMQPEENYQNCLTFICYPKNKPTTYQLQFTTAEAAYKVKSAIAEMVSSAVEDTSIRIRHALHAIAPVLVNPESTGETPKSQPQPPLPSPSFDMSLFDAKFVAIDICRFSNAIFSTSNTSFEAGPVTATIVTRYPHDTLNPTTMYLSIQSDISWSISLLQIPMSNLEFLTSSPTRSRLLLNKCGQIQHLELFTVETMGLVKTFVNNLKHVIDISGRKFDTMDGEENAGTFSKLAAKKTTEYSSSHATLTNGLMVA